MNHLSINNLSLISETVIKVLNNKISEEQLKPTFVIKEIEEFIRKTYYTTDEMTKTLSLWIYGTYFYQQFKSGFPYLLITGGKGSGKSALTDIVELLSFAPWSNASTSDLATQLIIDKGMAGTLFIDEDDNLTSTKGKDNDVAKLLKEGYSKSDEYLRYESNSGNNVREQSSFGPKVITGELDDLLKCRCITFRCVQPSLDDMYKLEDVYEYKHGEKLAEIQSLVSRIALSAVIHSGELNEIVKKISNEYPVTDFESRNRLPLFAIDKLVGGSYMEELMQEYKTDLAPVGKDELVAKVERVLKDVSKKLVSVENKNGWVVDKRHDSAITLNNDGETFQIDSLHIKLFLMDIEPDNEYSLKDIHRAVRTIKRNLPVSIKDEVGKVLLRGEARQLFKGMMTLNVNRYNMNVNHFLGTL